MSLICGKVVPPDMRSRIFLRCFSCAHHVFFEEISPKFDEKALKHLMDRFYIFFEKSFYHFEFVSTYYLRLYNEITDNEIKLAKITSSDKVLVIGSGSIPATAEHIVRKTGAEVYGIDRDKEAVSKGKKYAAIHGLTSGLHIIHSEGSIFDVSTYDVIFVLYGIKGEQDLFNVIADSMNPSARIIFRQPYDIAFNTKILPEYIQTNYSVTDQIITPSLGSIISLILRHKK